MMSDEIAMTNDGLTMTGDDPDLTNAADLGVIFLSGDRILLRRDEIGRIARHRFVLGYFFALSFVIVLLDIFGDRRYLDIWVAVLVYQAVGLVSVLTMVFSLKLWLWLRGSASLVRVHFSPILFLTAVIVVCSSYWLKLQLVPTLPFGWGWLAAFILAAYVILEVTTTLIAVYVIPHMLTEIRRQRATKQLRLEKQRAGDRPEMSEDAALPQPLWVEVAGKRIPIDSILHIEAQGNYVNIQTASETHFLAAAFSAVVAQLPAGLGMQVHRSHWVARAAIVEMRRDHAAQNLVLTNDSQIPVAQRKLATVRQWLG